jgi:hypothetical protein
VVFGCLDVSLLLHEDSVAEVHLLFHCQPPRLGLLSQHRWRLGPAELSDLSLANVGLRVVVSLELLLFKGLCDELAVLVEPNVLDALCCGIGSDLFSQTSHVLSELAQLLLSHLKGLQRVDWVFECPLLSPEDRLPYRARLLFNLLSVLEEELCVDEDFVLRELHRLVVLDVDHATPHEWQCWPASPGLGLEADPVLLLSVITAFGLVVPFYRLL